MHTVLKSRNENWVSSCRNAQYQKCEKIDSGGYGFVKCTNPTSVCCADNTVIFEYYHYPITTMSGMKKVNNRIALDECQLKSICSQEKTLDKQRLQTVWQIYSVVRISRVYTQVRLLCMCAHALG